MKFIRVKMEVFVPMKKTVASNVLAEMDMVDNCATKKVYHSLIIHYFQVLVPKGRSPRRRICMYVCMCIYVCMYVCMCIYIYICMCLCTCVCVYEAPRMYTHKRFPAFLYCFE